MSRQQGIIYAELWNQARNRVIDTKAEVIRVALRLANSS